MSAFSFRILYSFIWIITLLPMRVLYIFSGPVYLILYHITGYRRKVVADNLKNAFPEKSDTELAEIGRKYYRHLTDLFLEALRMTHIGEKSMRRRYRVVDNGLLKKLKDEKRDVILVCGHYGNWEWLPAFPLYTDYKVISIYKPLADKRFEKVINRNRSKFGLKLAPMSTILREIITYRKEGINTISAFVSDQTPAKSEINYWTTFLNQDTPVYIGVEKVAEKFDMAIVFMNMKKVGRGYYDVELELLFDHTGGLPEYHVTEAHVRKLEEKIREAPEYWLWSHRRWKHKKVK